MDRLTLFGLFAVTAMLVFYALEARGRGYVLAFRGRMRPRIGLRVPQGAWPFGVVEAVWAVVAVRRWRLARRRAPQGA